MKVDVDAVHKRICHLLAIIRTESEAPPFVSIQQADVLDKERKNQQLVCGLVYSSENKLTERHLKINSSCTHHLALYSKICTIKFVMAGTCRETAVHSVKSYTR